MSLIDRLNQVCKNIWSLKRTAIVAFSLGILLTGGCAGPNTMEKAGVFVDDSVITTKVKALLVDEPMVSAVEIQVTTVNGVVQLSGFVETEEERLKATEIASVVNGVKSVDNVIALK